MFRIDDQGKVPKLLFLLVCRGSSAGAQPYKSYSGNTLFLKHPSQLWVLIRKTKYKVIWPRKCQPKRKIAVKVVLVKGLDLICPVVKMRYFFTKFLTYSQAHIRRTKIMKIMVRSNQSVYSMTPGQGF